MLGWPSVIEKYKGPTAAFRIEHMPWKAALRIVPQDAFLRYNSGAWVAAQTLEYFVPKGKREIRKREGPFDVALFEIGQWNRAWGDIHLGPVGALEAHARLGAKVLIPIHWSTFVLAYHAWSEPAETLVTEAAKRDVSVLTPRLGEPIEPAATPLPKTTAWWRALPPIAAKCP